MPHERIQIEESVKYSKEDTARLWSLAGLTETDRWAQGDEYGKLHTHVIKFRAWVLHSER